MKHDHDGEINHKLELPEEVTSGFARVKKHLRDNRTAYLTGVGCLAAGYFLRKPSVIEIINETAPVFNNMPTMNNIVHNTVNNGGYTRKIIRCVETDEMWPSMSKAAEAAGVSLDSLSKHIHGKRENINDFHYMIEGLAA